MVFKRFLLRHLLPAALSLLLIVAAGVHAADVPPKPAPADKASIDASIAELVKLVGAGRIDQMLDHIGPVLETEREEYEHSRERLSGIYNNAGKYSGFDIAGVKVLTPRYQVEYVLVYFEKKPVLFEFGFYMVDGKWRPQNFRVETDFKTVLDTMPLQK